MCIRDRRSPERDLPPLQAGRLGHGRPQRAGRSGGEPAGQVGAADHARAHGPVVAGYEPAGFGSTGSIALV
eukprot:6330897-Alexandrium_andersonii.AAC.1